MKIDRPFFSAWLTILAALTVTIPAEAQDSPSTASSATEPTHGAGSLDAGDARWRATSIDALRTAAEGGDATAQLYLGSRYERGEGVARSHEQATLWIGKSAEQGFTGAQFVMGLVMLKKENFQVASEWFQKAAAQGHLEAMVQMGDLYYYGKLGHKYQEAAKWFKRAAELGHVEAMLRLGDTYQVGRPDLSRDHVESARWYRKASEKGNPHAQYELALLLLEGDGITHDAQEAAKWLERAALAGHAKAELKLGILRAKGSDGTVDVTKLSMPALVAAMQEGNSEATLLLGVAHEQGRSGRPNYNAAAACYKHVLQSGEPAERVEAACRLINLYALDHAKPDSPDWVALLFPPRGPGVTQAQAQCQLGNLYFRGHALPEDWREAVGWFMRAAQNGSAEAMNRIGELWAAGVDGTPDPKEAARWYRKSASQGFAVAQFNLGRAYTQGEGVPNDPVEACKWLDLAAAQKLRAAVEELDQLQSRMTPMQVDEARRRAARFTPSQTESAAFQSKNLKTNGNFQGP